MKTLQAVNIKIKKEKKVFFNLINVRLISLFFFALSTK